jgi:hypothetical protein
MLKNVVEGLLNARDDRIISALVNGNEVDIPTLENFQEREEREQTENELAEQSTTIEQVENMSDEPKFAACFAAVIGRLDKIDSEAKKQKSEIIRDLAETLEDLGFPKEAIANEITHRLKNRASKAWIHEILEDKYKDKRRIENAKKRTEKPVGQEKAIAVDEKQLGPAVDQTEHERMAMSSVSKEMDEQQVSLVAERSMDKSIEQSTPKQEIVFDITGHTITHKESDPDPETEQSFIEG